MEVKPVRPLKSNRHEFDYNISMELRDPKNLDFFLKVSFRRNPKTKDWYIYVGNSRGYVVQRIDPADLPRFNELVLDVLEYSKSS